MQESTTQVVEQNNSAVSKIAFGSLCAALTVGIAVLVVMITKKK